MFRPCAFIVRSRSACVFRVERTRASLLIERQFTDGWVRHGRWNRNVQRRPLRLRSAIPFSDDRSIVDDIFASRGSNDRRGLDTCHGRVENFISDARIGVLDKYRRGCCALVSAGMALAIAGDTSQSSTLAADLEKRFPEDTSVRFSYLPALRAMIALNQGQPSKALNYCSLRLPTNLVRIAAVSPDCSETYIRATFEAKPTLRRTAERKPSPSSRGFESIAELWSSSLVVPAIPFSDLRSARSRAPRCSCPRIYRLFPRLHSSTVDWAFAFSRQVR